MRSRVDAVNRLCDGLVMRRKVSAMKDWTSDGVLGRSNGDEVRYHGRIRAGQVHHKRWNHGQIFRRRKQASMYRVEALGVDGDPKVAVRILNRRNVQHPSKCAIGTTECASSHPEQAEIWDSNRFSDTPKTTQQTALPLS